MLVNGESGNKVSALDRGLQYGDGLFETIAVFDARPCLWERHYQRLLNGGRRLGIAIPDSEILFNEIQQEIGSNTRGVIKIVISRGEGKRGYKTDPTAAITRLVNLTPWPDYPDHLKQFGIKAKVCLTKLGSNSILAGIKHLNRLEQVMARREWDDPDISEGLMLNTNCYVISGTMSNLFMIKDGVLNTPDLTDCGIEGVMRGLVLDVADDLGIETNIRKIEPAELATADSLFLTNSLIGIWPIREIEGKLLSLGYINKELIKEVNNRAYV